MELVLFPFVGESSVFQHTAESNLCNLTSNLCNIFFRFPLD